MSIASNILSALFGNSFERFMAFAQRQPVRGATRSRTVKGRNGTKRAGAYGRGLRNWITNKNAAAQAQRLAKRNNGYLDNIITV